MAFPSIRTPSSISQYPYKAQIKTEFENGKVSSRARATSSRWVFSLSWEALGQTDYATLCTYFNTMQGSTFSWTHPVTSQTFTVRFSENQLPEATNSGFIDGEQAWEMSGLKLEEN